MIIFICRCRAAFSHTAFRLSIIAIVYVSSNYHFIILMPNVSSHAGVGWEKRQTHRKEKGRERRSNASVDCNSELAFIYRDHWRGVGNGLSSPLDCYVCFYVQCCGFYLCTLQENSQQVLKRRSIFRVYYVRYHQNANVK